MSGKEKEKTVSIRLKKLHFHQGKECRPGDEITVRQSQADRLIKAGVAVEGNKKEFKGGE